MWAHLLEVELREDVEPVGELNDKEELEEEGHAGMWVALPQRGNTQKVFPGLKMLKDVNLNRQLSNLRTISPAQTIDVM